MITRRGLLTGAGAFLTAGFGLSGYALGVEPRTVALTRYRVAPRNWPAGLRLKIAALADIHACEPWMGVERMDEIVERTNALAPDLVVLLGDFVAGFRIGRFSTPVSREAIARALAKLKAPLGVHAVLGNHDWWEEPDVQRREAGPTRMGQALEQAGIPVYENNAVVLAKGGHRVWLAGLGDQWAFYRGRSLRKTLPRFGYRGVDDLPAMLAKVTDDAPIVLMAHEPDIFPEVPQRVALTLSGHTHGGQIRVLGYAPVVPSMYGSRYVYGHKVEDGRHLIVSAGLGCSALPVRLGAPPEIVVVDVGARAA